MRKEPKVSEFKIWLLLHGRDELYEANNNDQKVDEIAEEIIKYLKKDFNNYSVDFIIEVLTKIGQSPNLVYDGNGLFAVTGDAHSPVVTGDDKIEGTIVSIVTKDQWRSSIRLALHHYLFES